MKAARKRILAALLAVVLLMGGLPGCGAGDDEVVTVRGYITAAEAVAVAAEVAASSTYIDTSRWDESFVAALLESHPGIFSDGYLVREQAAQITSLGHTWGRNISSLEGIQYFTGLTALNVASNNLTSLDLSSNTELRDIRVGNNNLTVLDVSSNTALQVLIVSGNQLTSLDVSGNSMLDWLIVNDNQLTALDLSNNYKLSVLDVSGNQLTGIDVSNIPRLLFNVRDNYMSHPDDVIGWREWGRSLKPEDSEFRNGLGGYSFIFWPQRPPTTN